MSGEPTAVPATPAGPATPVSPGPVPTRRRSELGIIGLLLVLGAYLIVGARSITVPGSSNTVGPRAFPTMVGVILAAVAIALAVRVWRGDRADADTSEDVDADAPMEWRPVVVVGLAFGVHALLINLVGWPLSVTLMFTVVAWALGARSWWRSALWGGAVAVVVWIIFARLLGVAIPGGTLLEAVTEWM